MAVSNEVVTNLSKSKHTIKAQSTETINFMGAYPNYYRITNASNTNLYMGVSMTPTKNFYDMVVPAGSTKLFVDAYGHDNLYMFNPSTENANILITSFKAEFNPTVLAVSEIGTDFSDITINADTAIKSFECPLPSGTNTIGKVGLETAVSKDIQDIKTVSGGTYTNTESLKTSLSNIYTFLTNGITKTNISDIKTDTTNIYNKLETVYNEIVPNIEKIKNSIYKQEPTGEVTYLISIISAIQKQIYQLYTKYTTNDTTSKELILQYTSSYTMKFGNTKSGYVLSAPNNYYISCFSSANLDNTNTHVYNEGKNYTGTAKQTPIYNIIKPVQCEGSYYKYDIDLLKTDKVFIESATSSTMDVWVVFKKY